MTTKESALFETKMQAIPGDRTVIAKISTTSVDRDGDVVLPSGMDLENFWKIPTVLMLHNNRALPVAEVPKGGIQQEPHGVVAKARFLDRPPSLPANVEWQPDTLLDLFKQGAPLGFSIGFRIKEGGARFATTKDSKTFGEKVRRVITQWELTEFSVVAIPANQDAVAVAVSKCSTPVGSWTREALGLQPKAMVRILPREPKKLTMPGHVAGLRLRMD